MRYAPSAYELYVKGLEAWHNHRWADARTLFEEAVRIDPAFALAHGQLALVLERLGEGANALAHRRTVMAQLDRLPERQRLLAEATGEYETNPARSLELMERMLERYPDEEEAYDLIVHIFTFSQDPVYWKQTLAFMQRWARAIPGPGSGHFHNHWPGWRRELATRQQREPSTGDFCSCGRTPTRDCPSSWRQEHTPCRRREASRKAARGVASLRGLPD